MRPTIIAFLLLLWSATPIFAGVAKNGEERFYLQNLNVSSYTDSFATIQVSIRTDDLNALSVGEKAEFRVQNPRPGDYCVSTPEKTNQYGQIYAKCYASSPGTIYVYVYSLDRGQQSLTYSLYFYKRPAPQPITQKVIPPPSPLATKSAATPPPATKTDAHKSVDTVPQSPTQQPIQTPIPTQQDQNFFLMIWNWISQLLKI